VVQDFSITLSPGKEWHSKPIPLSRGNLVTLTALSNRRMYAGLFSRAEYARRRAAVFGAFSFEPGTDRPSFTSRIRIEEDDDYYLVFRLSTFAPGSAQIDVRWAVVGGD
jgi:hypothetical protein